MLTTIKSGLRWWSKIGAKLILSRVPMAYGFWQGVGLFRHGYLNTASYALGVFGAHVKHAGLDSADLEGNTNTLLAIGPGDSIATAIMAYAHGAKVILKDSGSFAKDTPETYRAALCNLFGSRGLRVPDLSRLHTIDEILTACNDRYITDGGQVGTK